MRASSCVLIAGVETSCFNLVGVLDLKRKNNLSVFEVFHFFVCANLVITQQKEKFTFILEVLCVPRADASLCSAQINSSQIIFCI